MIECVSLATTAGNFYGHLFRGKSEHLLVFIPGLMEPKAGLFYIWKEMARSFHGLGHSCFLFDLAGQGDSLLPISFNIWEEQRNAILNAFKGYYIHFIARGIGTTLITTDQMNVAIHPSLLEPVADQLKHIRWKQSPVNADHVTPEEPHALLSIEIDCFHRLGAEAECIGGLQLPATFVNELPMKLPTALPDNVLCYQAGDGHPLFEKQSQRDALFWKISSELRLRVS